MVYNILLSLLTATACLLHVTLSHCLDVETNPSTEAFGAHSFESAIPIDELIADGWTKCYSAPYHHPTSLSRLITDCPTTEDYYLFVGARTLNTTWGAYGPSAILTTPTDSSSLAYIPNGKWSSYYPYDVHWYNYRNKSFGFVLNEAWTYDLSDGDIDLSNDGCDVSQDGDVDADAQQIFRLSWRMNGDIGGCRAPVPGKLGAVMRNATETSSFSKVVYYKHCPAADDPRLSRPSSNWDDVPSHAPLALPTDTQYVALIYVAIIVLFYGILIAIEVSRLPKDAVEKKQSKQLSFMKRYAMPLTSCISLMAAYDLFGDVYFLTSDVFMVHVTINTHYGFVGCDMNAYAGYYFCEPFQSEPRFVTQEQINDDATNPLLKSNSKWTSIAQNFYNVTNWGMTRTTEQLTRGITLYGLTCYDVFHDNTVYTGPYSELFTNFDKCLHHKNGCDACPADCGFAYLDRSYEYQPYQAAYGYYQQYNEGMISCDDSRLAWEYGWLSTVYITILGCILFKEALKLVFIVLFFFSTKAQRSDLLRFAINSPLTGILTVFSPRFRTYIHEIKMDDSNRTMGLFIDLFFENLPQICLVLWVELKGTRIENIISLSGSILMVIKNVAMLVKYMRKDYQSTLVTNMSASQTGNSAKAQADIQTTQVETKQNESKFKVWFQSNVEEECGTEETEKYYIFLVDNGFDNFKAMKDVSHDELKEIGITKLGHRKIVISAAQKIESL